MRHSALSLALLAAAAFNSTVAQAEDAPKTVGWRTDGTGEYPKAEPPTQWAKDKGILWTADLPGRSNAIPVLVGDKLFINCDPCSLYCINPADGKNLWTAELTFKDVLSAEDWAKAEAEIQAAKAISKELSPLNGEITKLNRALKNAENKAEAEAKLEPLKKQAYDLQVKLKELKLAAQYEETKTHPSNTHTTPTPVTDGKHVWVLMDSGIAGCFDLEGKRVWARHIERPPSPSNWGYSSSPCLAGDKLIVHINDLIALDGATGEEKWRAKAKGGWGSPVATQIGGEWVVITPRGDFVRASDGKVMGNAKVALEYNTPVVKDGIAYFIQNGGKAVQLPEKLDENMELKTLWTTQPNRDRYYASPVIHDGLIYAVNRKNKFSAIDAKDGSIVYEQELPLGPGDTFPSIAMAGKYLFVGHDRGKLVVLEPGRTFKQVALNELEGFRSTPVFQGKRMYLRAEKHLYCIGE